MTPWTSPTLLTISLMAVNNPPGPCLAVLTAGGKRPQSQYRTRQDTFELPTGFLQPGPRAGHWTRIQVGVDARSQCGEFLVHHGWGHGRHRTVRHDRRPPYRCQHHRMGHPRFFLGQHRSLSDPRLGRGHHWQKLHLSVGCPDCRRRSGVQCSFPRRSPVDLG